MKEFYSYCKECALNVKAKLLTTYSNREEVCECCKSVARLAMVQL